MFFGDDADRRAAMHRLADIVARAGADGVLILAEAWWAPPTGTATADSAGRPIPPSQRPDRGEAIWITGMTREGRIRQSLTRFSRAPNGTIHFKRGVGGEHRGDHARGEPAQPVGMLLLRQVQRRIQRVHVAPAWRPVGDPRHHDLPGVPRSRTRVCRGRVRPLSARVRTTPSSPAASHCITSEEPPGSPSCCPGSGRTRRRSCRQPQ
jgi:hypothetical protein